MQSKAALEWEDFGGTRGSPQSEEPPPCQSSHKKQMKTVNLSKVIGSLVAISGSKRMKKKLEQKEERQVTERVIGNRKGAEHEDAFCSQNEREK